MPTTVKTCHKQTRKDAREADLKAQGGHRPLQNLQGALTMLMLRDLIPTGLPQIQDLNPPDPDLDLKHILQLILHILVQNHLNQLSMTDQDQISAILLHFQYLLHHSTSHLLM
jgi:hypothetical protein